MEAAAVVAACAGVAAASWPSPGGCCCCLVVQGALGSAPVEGSGVPGVKALSEGEGVEEPRGPPTVTGPRNYRAEAAVGAGGPRNYRAEAAVGAGGPRRAREVGWDHGSLQGADAVRVAAPDGLLEARMQVGNCCRERALSLMVRHFRARMPSCIGRCS